MRRGPGLRKASSVSNPRGAGKVSVGKDWGWAEGVAGVDLTADGSAGSVVRVAGSGPTGLRRLGNWAQSGSKGRAQSCRMPATRSEEWLLLTPYPIF